MIRASITIFLFSIIILMLSGSPAYMYTHQLYTSAQSNHAITLVASRIVEAPSRGWIIVNASTGGNGYVYLYHINGEYHAMLFDNNAVKEYAFTINIKPWRVRAVVLWMTSISDAVLRIRGDGSVYTVVLSDKGVSIHDIPIKYYYSNVYVKAIRVENNRTAVNVTVEYSTGTPDSAPHRYRFTSRRITLGTRPRIAFSEGYLFIVGMYETDIIYLPEMKHWKYVYLEPAPVEVGVPSAVAILSKDGDRPARVAYLSGNTIRVLDFGEENVSLVKKFSADTISYPEYIYAAGENTLYIVCRESLHIIKNFMDSPVNYVLENNDFYAAGSVNDYPVIIYKDALLVRPPGNSSLSMVYSPRVAVFYEIQSGASENQIKPLRTRPLEPVIWYYSKLALTPGANRLKIEDYGYPYIPLQGTALTAKPDLVMNSSAFTVFLRGGIAYYTPLLAADNRVVIRAYSMRDAGLGVKAYYVSADMTVNKSIYDVFIGYMAGVPTNYNVYENAWFFDPVTKRLAQVLYVSKPNTGSWRAVIAVSRVTTTNISVEKRIDIGDPDDNDPYHIALTRDGYIILVYGGYDHIYIDVYSPNGERISHIANPPQLSPSIRGSVSVSGIIPYGDGWLVLFKFDGATSLYPAYYVSRTGDVEKIHATIRFFDKTGIYGGVAVIVNDNNSTAVVAPENGMHTIYNNVLYTVYPYNDKIYIVSSSIDKPDNTRISYLPAPRNTQYTLINKTHLYVFTRIGDDIAVYRYSLSANTVNPPSTTEATGGGGEPHTPGGTTSNASGTGTTQEGGGIPVTYIAVAVIAVIAVIAIVMITRR